jgi:hypothetical protein
MRLQTNLKNPTILDFTFYLTREERIGHNDGVFVRVDHLC